MATTKKQYDPKLTYEQNKKAGNDTSMQDWDNYYKPQIDKNKDKLVKFQNDTDTNKDGKMSKSELDAYQKANPNVKVSKLVDWIKKAKEAKNSTAEAVAKKTIDTQQQNPNIYEEYSQWQPDETYMKNLENTVGEKVKPYYDKLKNNLEQNYGLQLEKLQNDYNYANESYDIQQNNLNLKGTQNQQSYDNTMKDISQYTQYAKDDFTKNMATTDKSFAYSMARATDAYGQRGLLNSGVQAYGNSEAVGQVNDAKKGIENAYDKTMYDLSSNRDKAIQNYTNMKTALGFEQNSLDLSKRKTDTDYNVSQRGLALDKSGKLDEMNKDMNNEIQYGINQGLSREYERQAGDLRNYLRQKRVPTTL